MTAFASEEPIRPSDGGGPGAAPIPSAADLRSLLSIAILAPSSHNAQPWRFRLGGDRVDLLADRSRSLPASDPADRELTIGCGACLFYLRLAIRRAGRADHVVLLPDPGNPDLLARVRLGAGREPAPGDVALCAAIPHRRTNRQPFAARPVPPALVATLQADAVAERCTLRVIAGEGPRTAVAELVEEADRRQAADLRFRQELATWVHPARSARRDGLPDATLSEEGLLSYVERSDRSPEPAAPVASAEPSAGEVAVRRTARDLQVVTGSPLLVLLATAGDAPRDWLATGQALARILLRATAAGVAASFLNQPIEVDSLRPRLAAVLGEPGRPQLLLRLGYGPDVPPTPRRPVDEVLVRREEGLA
jgi:nitroreductase